MVFVPFRDESYIAAMLDCIVVQVLQVVSVEAEEDQVATVPSEEGELVQCKCLQ